MRKGDKVILVTTRHGSHSNNPYYKDYPNVTGIITKIPDKPVEDHLDVIVRWCNTERTNSYDESDLRLYNPNLEKIREWYT